MQLRVSDDSSTDDHHDHDSHGHGGHHHGAHDHSVDFSNVNTSFIIAVVANLAFTILEAFYGFLTGSVSLLGDAGHNLSDVLGLLLAWGAAYLSGRQSSALYSYGFRRSTILAALINAVVLVFAAGFIAWESVEKFLQPSPMSEMTVMVVASIGILVNAGTAMLFMRGSHDDLNMRGAFLHLAYDALISAGVVIAAVIILYTGWQWIDPLMGLLIVVIIL
ncbi:MAG: cobalt-zinc-cadmium efflux system protein, partial [Crocinitomicaceae bacterium]